MSRGNWFLSDDLYGRRIVSYQTIQLEFRGAVAVLTLNRPASLQALTVEMGREFQAAVSEALQRGVRAIGRKRTTKLLMSVAAFIEKKPPKFVGG